MSVTDGFISGNNAVGDSGATADGNNLYVKAGVKYNGTVLDSDYIEN